VIGFYSRDEKCLQRGMDWVFKYSSLFFAFKWLKVQPYFIEIRSIISVTKHAEGEQMNKRAVHNNTSTLSAPSRELLHQRRTQFQDLHTRHIKS
jgi:hypothetical protein